MANTGFPLCQKAGKFLGSGFLILGTLLWKPAVLFGTDWPPIQWTAYHVPAKFEHLSVDQGLSQNSVFCIIQDSKGFLWFGTEDGLNKYDGYDFTVFRPDPQDPFALKNNSITTLFEDRAGTLWVGTRGGGLSCFDREKERFISFQYDVANSASLSSDDITCLIQDAQGRYWIGTDGGGLVQMTVRGWGQQGPVVSFVTYVRSEFPELGSDNISALFADNRGNLWIGSEAGGLSMIIPDERNGSRIRFRRFAPLAKDPGASPPRSVIAINEDANRLLWLGGRDGLYRLDPETLSFRHFRHAAADPDSLSHDYVRVVYKDRVGTLWIGTDGGGLNKLVAGGGGQRPPVFLHYANDTRMSSSLQENAVESIYEDRSGVLWIGHYSSGLSRLILNQGNAGERENRPFVQYQSTPYDPSSLSSNFINAILEDRRRNLWIGTDGGGLNRVHPPADKRAPLRFQHFRARPQSSNWLNDDVITAILEDIDGSIWIGTYTGGLSRLLFGPAPDAPPRFERFPIAANEPGGLGSDFIMSLFLDRERNLWVGTIDGGLGLLDRETRRFTCFSSSDTVSESLSDSSVFAIAEDHFGSIWVGTADGLNRFDRSRRNFVSYHHDPQIPGSLNGDNIRCLFDDGRSHLWIGTDNGGLNLLVNDDPAYTHVTFQHFTIADGLPSNAVMGILNDRDGNLWFSTTGGLCRFNPQTKKIKNYNSKDGLQSNEFRRGAYCKSRSGEMFFGGANGFNVFRPEAIYENHSIPPIVIMDFQIFNRSVPIQKPTNGRLILQKSITETREINLSYKDYVFSFEFAALHYVAPEKNQYAYMMEGLENRWNYVGNRRFVTYTTLPAGEYVFRVKGANNDGVWNNQGLALKIVISPPFWKTGWFYGLCIALTILVSVGAYRLRVHELKKRKLELEQLVVERTTQLEAANRELERLATFDAMTGIANFRSFSTFMNHEWKQATRNASSISLMLIDVDFFKNYNDFYGHQSGNTTLWNIAQAISRCARRSGDMVARYGGEEFAVALTQTEEKKALEIAERMRQEVQDLQIPHEQSPICPYVTISLGLTSSIPTKEENYQDLLKKADKALYRSKQNGRNRVTVASANSQLSLILDPAGK